MWIICTVYIEIQQNQCRTTILFVLTKGVVIYGIIKFFSSLFSNSKIVCKLNIAKED